MSPVVIIVKGRVRVLLRRLEPRVLIGGALRHEIDQHANAAAAGLASKLDKIGDGAGATIDGQVIGNIIAIVPARARVAGQEPKAGDTEIDEIIEMFTQPDKVADTIAVGIGKRPDIDRLNDAVFVPEIMFRHADHTHAAIRGWRYLPAKRDFCRIRPTQYDPVPEGEWIVQVKVSHLRRLSGPLDPSEPAKTGERRVREEPTVTIGNLVSTSLVRGDDDHSRNEACLSSQPSSASF